MHTNFFAYMCTRLIFLITFLWLGLGTVSLPHATGNTPATIAAAFANASKYGYSV